MLQEEQKQFTSTQQNTQLLGGNQLSDKKLSGKSLSEGNNLSAPMLGEGTQQKTSKQHGQTSDKEISPWSNPIKDLKKAVIAYLRYLRLIKKYPDKKDLPIEQLRTLTKQPILSLLELKLQLTAFHSSISKYLTKGKGMTNAEKDLWQILTNVEKGRFPGYDTRKKYQPLNLLKKWLEQYLYLEVKNDVQTQQEIVDLVQAIIHYQTREPKAKIPDFNIEDIAYPYNHQEGVAVNHEQVKATYDKKQKVVVQTFEQMHRALLDAKRREAAQEALQLIKGVSGDLPNYSPTSKSYPITTTLPFNKNMLGADAKSQSHARRTYFKLKVGDKLIPMEAMVVFIHSKYKGSNTIESVSGSSPVGRIISGTDIHPKNWITKKKDINRGRSFIGHKRRLVAYMSMSPAQEKIYEAEVERYYHEAVIAAMVLEARRVLQKQGSNQADKKNEYNHILRVASYYKKRYIDVLKKSRSRDFLIHLDRVSKYEEKY